MTWTRLCSTWLLLAVLMPVNGMLREFGFKRLLPDTVAEVLSVVTGIALILVVTREGAPCARCSRTTRYGTAGSGPWCW